MSIMLSPHFSLAEAVKSSTATRLGIDNSNPPDDVIARMQDTAATVLEAVRSYYQRPVIINSFYRCLELNRAIKSKDNSQHVTGEAVDLEVPGIANADVAAWIRDNLTADQIILEFYTSGIPDSGWVHCSFVAGGPNRQECLTIGPNGTQVGLIA